MKNLNKLCDLIARAQNDCDCNDGCICPKAHAALETEDGKLLLTFTGTLGNSFRLDVSDQPDCRELLDFLDDNIRHFDIDRLTSLWMDSVPPFLSEEERPTYDMLKYDAYGVLSETVRLASVVYRLLSMGILDEFCD